MIFELKVNINLFIIQVLTSKFAHIFKVISKVLNLSLVILTKI